MKRSNYLIFPILAGGILLMGGVTPLPLPRSAQSDEAGRGVNSFGVF